MKALLLILYSSRDSGSMCDALSNRLSCSHSRRCRGWSVESYSLGWLLYLPGAGVLMSSSACSLGVMWFLFNCKVFNLQCKPPWGNYKNKMELNWIIFMHGLTRAVQVFWDTDRGQRTVNYFNYQFPYFCCADGHHIELFMRVIRVQVIPDPHIVFWSYLKQPTRFTQD